MKVIKIPKGLNSFSILWQYMRFISFIVAAIWFIVFSLKAHCHVVDIEIDLHGYIDRLWKEAERERSNPEQIFQELLKNTKEKETNERE